MKKSTKVRMAVYAAYFLGVFAVGIGLAFVAPWQRVVTIVFIVLILCPLATYAGEQVE
jgi:hypothetical protein